MPGFGRRHGCRKAAASTDPHGGRLSAGDILKNKKVFCTKKLKVRLIKSRIGIAAGFLWKISVRLVLSIAPCIDSVKKTRAGMIALNLNKEVNASCRTTTN
jgi:hypothetical protein